MSFVHLKYAFENPVEGHARHLTYLALAFHADEKSGQCWPSIQTLCRETTLGRVSVSQAIGALEKAGRISVQKYRGPHHVHRYTVHLLNSSSGEQFSTYTPTVQMVNGNCSSTEYKSPVNHKESPIRPTTPHGVGSAITHFQQADSSQNKELDALGCGAAPHFEAFWAAYPKKRSKGDAEKAWRKVSPSEGLRAVIMAKVREAKASESWSSEGGKYIPYPATWLNAKGWEDEYRPLNQPVKRLPL